jgi:hypothetical protein
MTESKSKRARKMVQEVEPESCGICLENYTTILRKKITCKYCNESACSKCIERYLLDRIEDAHCLHCRVNYNDETLRNICTKTYLQQTYFKHRQEILINRERAQLPGLQEAAVQERKKREDNLKITAIRAEIEEINKQRQDLTTQYTNLYKNYYTYLKCKIDVSKTRKEMDTLLQQIENLRDQLTFKQNKIHLIKYPQYYDLGGQGSEARTAVSPQEDEKKKFIRRCTNNGCQGFLSTAWKCGICEYYSCNKCFKVKTKNKDDEHTCLKEDVETAELIKKDSKPCPNCGEFIMKTSGCSQMFCISCQTPWDWNTGKVVTSGIIHNPHYYEWMKRNGGQAPRNPADVPCGGYPNGWDIRRMPRGLHHSIADKYYEFHRICLELQEISTRTYRTHIDTDNATNTNVRFLLGDYDEKRWGQLLAKNERKKKRDYEVQEIFGAFRMIAVELINRVHNYNQGGYTLFTNLPVPIAEQFLKDLYKEIDEFINVMNNALKQVSINFNYSVPYFTTEGAYYRISTKNFSADMKKKRISKKKTDVVADDEDKEEDDGNKEEDDGDKEEDDGDDVNTIQSDDTDSMIPKKGHIEQANKIRNHIISTNDLIEDDAFTNEDNQLQAAIAASLITK